MIAKGYFSALMPNKIGKISKKRRQQPCIRRTSFLPILFLTQSVNPTLHSDNLTIAMHLVQELVDRVPIASLCRGHYFRDAHLSILRCLQGANDKGSLRGA
jgi:hypothetical protein